MVSSSQTKPALLTQARISHHFLLRLAEGMHLRRQARFCGGQHAFVARHRHARAICEDDEFFVVVRPWHAPPIKRGEALHASPLRIKLGTQID
jgi:hypothetical protein